MASDIPSALRQQVAERANSRCEYCLIHEDDSGHPHQIDHILSRKHGGDSSFENLAYACIFCNRYKGSDTAAIDPDTGLAVALFHPRRDEWNRHFRFLGEILEGQTPTARATIRILQINASDRLAERELLFALPR